MKVVQVNCVYPHGSTGSIVKSIHSALQKDGMESYVFYGRGDKVVAPNVTKFSAEIEAKIHSAFTRATGEQFSFSPVATQRLIRAIDSIHPDIVHLHCLNGHCVNLYKLLMYLKEKKIKTVLTLHAEIMHTAGCEHALDCNKWIDGCYECEKVRGLITHFYRDDAKICYKKMEDAISGFQNLTVVSVSDWLGNRAKQSAIFHDPNIEFRTIFNGVDTSIFHPISDKTKNVYFTTKKSKPIVLHVTPNFNHPLKGGMKVIETAKLHPEYDFWIVGYNSNIQLPNNVKGIPHTKNREELANIYNAADVTLITSQRETFSMVCAESLCCGTPVAGFYSGGPESIGIPEYTRFVDQDDLEKLGHAIGQLIGRKIPQECYKSVLDTYSDNNMVQQYRNVYYTQAH